VVVAALLPGLVVFELAGKLIPLSVGCKSVSNETISTDSFTYISLVREKGSVSFPF
jgi:hypothetical protein